MANTPTLSSLDYLQDRVRKVLEHAEDLGATSAAAAITDEKGLNVNVRKGEIETLEHTHDRFVGVSVYIGQSKGQASSGDMSDKGLFDTVKAAVNIAKYTSEDPCAGLPEKELLCTEFPDLSLNHPWDISTEQAVEICRETEEAAVTSDKRIVNTEGASLSTNSGAYVLGNTLGFCHGYEFTDHSLGACVIAEDSGGMQTGAWFSGDTVPERLESPAEIGRTAAQRAVSMLSAKTIETGKYPVVFENYAAKGLFRLLKAAASGSNLYRKSSFLVDSLGKKIFPDFLTIVEDPYVVAAYGSAPFDDEGVKPYRRELVSGGVLKGYFLSTYTARKLGMKTTGHASGAYNLYVGADADHSEANLEELLKRMGTGFLVTSLIGQGVNLTTGDYSRGAKGFWVRDGRIVHPVDGVTIAGNIGDMFAGIEAVGQDIGRNDNYFTGSVLLKEMSVASS